MKDNSFSKILLSTDCLIEHYKKHKLCCARVLRVFEEVTSHVLSEVSLSVQNEL